MDDPPRLSLLGGETIGLSSAEACPDDILAELEYPRLDQEFRQHILAQRNDIEATVCRLLGIPFAYMWGELQWQSGSFNLAIPIEVGRDRIVFLRLPLPYRNTSPSSDGPSDERLRSEIATYLWMERHCPDVPIPTLHAFGLPDGQCYTHPGNTPLWARLAWGLRRLVRALLGQAVPTRHVRRHYQNPLGPGYLLLSEAKGEPLARHWEDRRHDETFRRNLCRSLASIALSMNRIPLPRIGSWTLEPSGAIALSNRPLHLHMNLLESQGVPSGMPRDRTYTAAGAYLADLLALHDSRILHQPNAVLDAADGRTQLAALTGLRATMHHFVARDDPIHLCLTDLRPPNVFVDAAGSVTAVIDLEFACARPASMHLPPHWLAATPLDALAAPGADEREAPLREYVDVYEAEERARNGDAPYAAMLRRAWASGAFWYGHAVMAPNHACHIFQHRIRPRYGGGVDESVFNHVFSRYWSVDSEDVLQARVESTDRYTSRVRQAFSRDSRGRDKE